MSFAKLAESPFIKGTDITQPQVMTIAGTREASFKENDGSERSAAVLKFYEMDKELVLNKTNLTYLLDELGKDERLWINKQIVLRSMPARDNRTGQQTRRLFVEVPQAAVPPPQQGARPTPPPQDDLPQSWGANGQPVTNETPIPDPDYPPTRSGSKAPF